jgi:hypothetical protein
VSRMTYSRNDGGSSEDSASKGMVTGFSSRALRKVSRNTLSDQEVINIEDVCNNIERYVAKASDIVNKRLENPMMAAQTLGIPKKKLFQKVNSRAPKI